MKQHYYQVVITQDEDGMYLAEVPNLHGCHSQAKDLATLYKRIEEAIELCLEVRKKKKEWFGKMMFIGVQQVPVSV